MEHAPVVDACAVACFCKARRMRRCLLLQGLHTLAYTTAQHTRNTQRSRTLARMPACPHASLFFVCFFFVRTHQSALRVNLLRVRCVYTATGRWQRQPRRRTVCRVSRDCRVCRVCKEVQKEQVLLAYTHTTRLQTGSKGCSISRMLRPLTTTCSPTSSRRRQSGRTCHSPSHRSRRN